MKLKQKEITTYSNIDEGQSFNIVQNAKMFEILSSKIYMYKIAAVVRELISNAVDSHIEAGKGDVPVKVTLPNMLHPYFEVVDEGIGMDEQFVYDTFGTYGASTKGETNDAIGSYGIGAKTPFAYTNSFSITAVKDGIETVYDAYLNAGSPYITTVNSTPTSKPNGVAIKIPVSESDFDTFLEEAKFICSFFPVRPDVKGGVEAFEFDFDESFINELDEKGYAISPTGKQVGSRLYQLGRNRNFAVMGGVCYPFYREVVPTIFSTQETASVFVKFDIGEIDIPAARENVSDDVDTENAIKARTKQIKDEYRENIQKQIDECKNIIHAHLFINQMIAKETFISSRNYEGVLNEHFNYNDHPFNFTRKMFSNLAVSMYKEVKAGRYSHRSYYKRQKSVILMDIIKGFNRGKGTFKVIYSSNKRKRELASMGKENPYSLILDKTNVSQNLLDRIKNLLHVEGFEVEFIDINDHVTKTTPRRYNSGRKLDDHIIHSRRLESNYITLAENKDPLGVAFSTPTTVDVTECDVFYVDEVSPSNDVYFEDGDTTLLTSSDIAFFNAIYPKRFNLIVRNGKSKRKIESNGIESFQEVYKRVVEPYQEEVFNLNICSEFCIIKWDIIQKKLISKFFNFHSNYYEYMIYKGDGVEMADVINKAIKFCEKIDLNVVPTYIGDKSYKEEKDRLDDEVRTKMKEDDNFHVMFGPNDGGGYVPESQMKKKFELLVNYDKLLRENEQLKQGN